MSRTPRGRSIGALAVSAGTMLALIAPMTPAHAETRYRQINQAAITAVAADSATATESDLQHPGRQSRHDLAHQVAERKGPTTSLDRIQTG